MSEDDVKRRADAVQRIVDALVTLGEKDREAALAAARAIVGCAPTALPSRPNPFHMTPGAR